MTLVCDSRLNHPLPGAMAMLVSMRREQPQIKEESGGLARATKVRAVPAAKRDGWGEAEATYDAVDKKAMSCRIRDTRRRRCNSCDQLNYIEWLGNCLEPGHLRAKCSSLQAQLYEKKRHEPAHKYTGLDSQLSKAKDC